MIEKQSSRGGYRQMIFGRLRPVTGCLLKDCGINPAWRYVRPQTKFQRNEPRSMGKRVLPRSSSFVRGLVAAEDRSVEASR
jgi:hypothetical protein